MKTTAMNPCLRILRTASITSALALTGCIGPPALETAVVGYDEAMARLDQEVLLLNIARTEHGLPVHFTQTRSVAATFEWSSQAGVLGTVRPGGQDQYGFTLSAKASERPTFSISPVTGKQFTDNIMRPLDENFFNFNAFQGGRLDQSLRLMAEGIEVQNPDGTFKYMLENDPSMREDYEEFRRIVTHMHWLDQEQKLFIRTLVFREVVVKDYRRGPDADDIPGYYDRGYRWRQNDDGEWEFSRATWGRVVVTNYDPKTLSDFELKRLNDRIKKNPMSFVYLDIHPDHPGGDFPINGVISMRSINQIIEFIAGGMGENPEFDVPKDPRTGDVDSGPANTLSLDKEKSKPGGYEVSAHFNGWHYSVADTKWDRQAFTKMAYLFQNAFGDIKDPGIPITISQ